MGRSRLSKSRPDRRCSRRSWSKSMVRTTRASRSSLASCVELFENTDDIVDIDDSVEATAPRIVVSVDRATRQRLLGVSQASVTRALQTALSGEDVTYVRDGYQKYPLPVRLELRSQTSRSSTAC